jgi:hypothetical protein
LYLRKFKNFSIVLRGKPVQQFNIADDLQHSKVATYKPQLGIGMKEVRFILKIKKEEISASFSPFIMNCQIIFTYA